MCLFRIDFGDLNGADLYDLWYNKVILCCLKAGAKKRDSLGNVISFNSKKDRLVNNPKKLVGKHSKKINRPWLDEECEKAVKEKRRAYLRVLNSPSRENLIKYRIASYETRKCLRKRKRANFKSFVSNIASMSISQF